MKKELIVIFFALFLISCLNIVYAENSITRTISKDKVVLKLNFDNNLSDDEILMVTEAGEISNLNINPYASNGSVTVWIFAKNPPQLLGNFTVIENIPKTISYNIRQNSSISGKWVLYVSGEEGLIGNSENSNKIIYYVIGILIILIIGIIVYIWKRKNF